jgi:DsbC/DsbD-like thiol-disulfide interchange protein
VLWPAPTRFDEQGSISLGYLDGLLLPVLITAEDPGSPVSLALRIHIGVCKDICIPVDATLHMEIGVGDQPSQYGPTLRAALDRVPKVQLRGVYCPHAVVTAKKRVVNGKNALVVKTSYDERASGLDLFAEAPDPLTLPIPVLQQPQSSRGRSHYVIAFDSIEAEKALKGQTVILTAVSDQGSCETSWRME